MSAQKAIQSILIDFIESDQQITFNIGNVITCFEAAIQSDSNIENGLFDVANFFEVFLPLNSFH